MFLYNCDFDDSTFGKFLFCNAFLLLCWLGNQFAVVRSWHVLGIECSFCLNESENDITSCDEFHAPFESFIESKR